jgi:hypothetical protein
MVIRAIVTKYAKYVVLAGILSLQVSGNVASRY